MLRNLILLIIGILLCSLESRATGLACEQNEVFATSGPKRVATCENREASVELESGERCLCSKEWMVRNDKNVCIPVWKCPNMCPPLSVFHRCMSDYKPEFHDPDFTAKIFTEKCKPACRCIKGNIWDRYSKKCIPVTLSESWRRRFDFGLG